MRGSSKAIKRSPSIEGVSSPALGMTVRALPMISGGATTLTGPILMTTGALIAGSPKDFIAARTASREM